ncbi:hypothetical protein KL86DES1_10415 [uncultured Desulfovibrio sp.]|uniref:Uncharacterized protein n=1 Tax=uncultured Desulfovibrio sp. TaxID=167968 RepID=A0A212KYR4_9BACT|nr:hypothetical protein KL86DES1_10415 [uncultured Desulfovibrio sp.]VZH32288.1 conserved protein of unknown function [Desulfovibrio sp. 86]
MPCQHERRGAAHKKGAARRCRSPRRASHGEDSQAPGTAWAVWNDAQAVIREALTKEPLGNALVFRLTRRELFLRQEWTLPSPTVSKKVKQGRQTE